MDEKIDSLEKNLFTLSKEIIEVKELIGKGFQKVANNFDVIKKGIDSLHFKVDLLNKKVDSLEGSTSEGLEDVGLKLENLSEEISKINTVTQYDKQFDNLKGFN